MRPDNLITAEAARTDALRPVADAVTVTGVGAVAAVARLWESIGLRTSTAAPAADDPPHILCVVQVGNEAFGLKTPSPALPRERIARVADAMARRGSGRVVLVTDAGPHVHGGADPRRAAERDADVTWFRHMARRWAASGVHANAVRVGYAPFLGHRLDPEREARLLRHLVIRRPAEPRDLAAALRLLVSAGCGNLVGEVVPLDGGVDAAFVPMPGGGRRATAAEASAAAEAAAGPDPFALDGRTALVTGASSGIGAAAAVELAARGADVVLAARRMPELVEVAERVRALGRAAHVLQVDLAEPGQAARMVEAAWERGGVDVLVYAAGIVAFDRLNDDGGLRDRVFAVNALAYAETCEAVAARWIAEGRPGAVAGVSSLSAVCAPCANLLSYGASKAAMTRYTAHFATTTARHGLRANCVLPGFVRTPMTDVTNTDYLAATLDLVPTGRQSEPEEVAALLCYLVAPASAYLTGAALRLDGGGHTLLGLP